jgi:hypothetical protein
LEEFNLPFPPGDPPPECDFSIRAWLMMGKQIDYAALPVICEILGIADIETLLTQLICIRDNKWKQ